MSVLVAMKTKNRLHPRLEELRKRLLNQLSSNQPLIYKTKANSERPFSSKSVTYQALLAAASRSAESAQEAESEKSNTTVSQTEAQKKVNNSQTTPESTNLFTEAVTELFNPVRLCQQQISEIVKPSEVIENLTVMALEVSEVLMIFSNNIDKFASSFKKTYKFRDEVRFLAESFAPIRGLHEQMLQIEQSVRACLVGLGCHLQSVESLKVTIADLMDEIECLSELQHKLYELSGNA